MPFQTPNVSLNQVIILVAITTKQFTTAELPEIHLNFELETMTALAKLPAAIEEPLKY